jgi:hypothetical protein
MYVRTYMYVYMYVCMYICRYVCMYVCMYACRKLRTAYHTLIKLISIVQYYKTYVALIFIYIKELATIL